MKQGIPAAVLKVGNARCNFYFSSGIRPVGSCLLTMPSCIFALLSIFGLARASTIKRQAITPLSSTQIESFRPFTFYAAAAYCLPSQTLSWSCGGLFLNRSVLLSGFLHPPKKSAKVTPPFNLTLPAVMGRLSSTVRDFLFLDYHSQPRGLTSGLDRVRWVGPLLELRHRRPPGYKSKRNVSVGWV